MDYFWSTLQSCSLFDLGFTRARFTWSNGRHGEDLIRERLDRAVANRDWISLYCERVVHVLAARSYDHMPLLMCFSPKIEEVMNIHKGFKFEAKWHLDSEYGAVLEEAWKGGDTGQTGLQTVQNKLANCQRTFIRWNGRKFRNVERLIRNKTKELELLQASDDPEQWADIACVKKEIEILMEQEDIKWKQRAKQNWYQNGDRNTPFFHAWADHRRRINHIHSITDEEGRVWKNKKDIPKIFSDFFQRLFHTGGVAGVKECLENLETRVTNEMNEDLIKEFTMMEVDKALSQMHHLKSPGPDSFSACFYQQAWPSIRMEVGKAVLDFVNHVIFDLVVNSTYIVLIPKNSSPSCVSDYRPISLCNVLYKLMAKVLANRMKKMLNVIISQNQTAFLPGRLITDNIIVAFEALHTMNTRLKGRQGYMALKLDMSKANDRVEWDFLEIIMRRLGFHDRWIKLVMICVRSVTYSVLINGVPHGHIRPSRGIRQGDPLSPYLFILCAEGLSHSLCKAEKEGKINGLAIAKGGTKINHLLFADDSILFCKANFVEWGNVHKILEVYEIASGQKLNREKTSIFFSKNTKVEFKDFIASISGLNITSNLEKYLGLPALIGQSRKRAFAGIKSRIWEKMQGWNESFLSQAGKEVLLKVVIQAILTYTMSVFQLPKSLCKEINSLMSKFFWGQKQKDKCMVWMGWSKMGKAKEKRWIGFPRFRVVQFSSPS
jgi:hypothetical protein